MSQADGLEIVIPRELSTSAEWTKYAKTQIQVANGNYTDPRIKLFGKPITWSNLLKEPRVRRDIKKSILPKADIKRSGPISNTPSPAALPTADRKI